MANVQQLIQSYEKLKSDRQQFEQVWRVCSDFVAPQRARLTEVYGIEAGLNSSQVQAARRNVFDGTADAANDTFASNLIGLLANQAVQWFLLDISADKTKEEKVGRSWLQQASKQLLSYMLQPKSQLYSSLMACMKDIGRVGTTGIGVREGVDGTPIVFYPVAPEEMVISEDSDGNINLIMRELPMTGAQLIDKHSRGRWDISPEMLQQAKDAPFKNFKLLHAIYPRNVFAKKPMAQSLAQNVSPQEMPIASVYVDMKSKEIVHESGYMEPTISVARWEKINGEVWGDSPTRRALADILTLNQASKGMMYAMEYMLQPALQVPHEGVYGHINLSPAGITYTDPDKGTIQPINSGINAAPHYQWEELKRQQIRQAYYIDVFQTSETPDMTATEVVARQNEKLKIIAPKAARVQAELLGPMVERALMLCIREGYIDQPPEGLLNEQLRINYVSPVVNAQRSEESMNATNFVLTTAQVAELYPQALDHVDFDAYVRYMHSQSYAPEAILKEERKVKQAREQRQEQEQMQADMMQAKEAAETAKTAGQAQNELNRAI